MSLKLNKTNKFAVLDLPSVNQNVIKNNTNTNNNNNSNNKTSGGVSTSEPLDNLYKSPLSVAEKVAIAMSVGEEVITEEELTALYTAREHPIVYDGFEPSGRMHIAQGVLRAIKVINAGEFLTVADSSDDDDDNDDDNDDDEKEV